MGLVTTILAGGAFGLALAAPPGPMNAVIAEESVIGGWGAGFRAGLGAMTADACFLVLALAGVVTIVQELAVIRAAMVATGGLVMLWFAYGAAVRSRNLSLEARTGTAGVGTRTPASGGRGFRKALVLALTNPYQILFWLTVGVGLLHPGTADLLGMTPFVGQALEGILVVRTGSVGLVAGLFGGILVWIVSFPAALVSAERRMAALTPVIAGLSAGVLGLAGVAFLVDATRTLATG